MKSKLLNYICPVFLFLCICSACVEDIELGDASMQEPDISQQVVLDSLFSNKIDAQRVLTSAYAQLWYGLPWYWNERGQKMNMGVLEALGDNYQSYLSWDNLNRAYYTGNMDSGKEGAHSKYWYGTSSTNDPNAAEGQWVGIRRAYVFLENVDRVPDYTEEEKQRVKGEAKMVIACLHADMFRHFGGLCCVDRAYDPNEDLKVERKSVKETVKFITDLCDSAYKVLPWVLPASEVSTWDGRFTGSAALGLKIRVLLFAASPLFNADKPYRPASEEDESVRKHQVWTGGYDPSMWQDVVDACELFFRRQQEEGGVPALTTTGADYKTIFRNAYFQRAGNGGESLISTRIRTNGGSYSQWDYYYYQANGYGITNATLEYTDMFPMADGTPFDASVWDRYEEGEALLTDAGKDPFVDRDPRLYETCVVNGMSYRSRKAQCYIGGSERGENVTGYLDGSTIDVGSGNGTGNFCSGIGNFKFNLGSTSSGGLVGQSNIHWPYLRLAEIYLSYAEALNEVGRTDDAFQYVDAIRDRVGLQGLQASNLGKVWNTDTFREEVLRERACEFGLEEVRFFDLIRWKREADFRKRLHGLLIYRILNQYNQEIGYSYQKVALQKRYIQDTDEGKVNFDPKWYLSAFPLDEVRKNYGLTQNPGW
ncbi:MAG: RagB/SusD family nutrient uptake outer membrane protein [Candidatus Symbiothrix sp.]|nr:RagB/SusD family nutrient uptake outer membrane protein [Candidatus Symbiothrix sp.]